MNREKSLIILWNDYEVIERKDLCTVVGGGVIDQFQNIGASK